MSKINLGKVVGDNGKSAYEIWLEQGNTGTEQEFIESLIGQDGKGISKIEKTSTVGLIDTYTITYTDGTTSTYEVKNGANGSGEGGTSDYTALENLPSINGVTLTGNKTTEDLGIEIPEVGTVQFDLVEQPVLLKTMATRTVASNSIEVELVYDKYKGKYVATGAHVAENDGKLCVLNAFDTSNEILIPNGASSLSVTSLAKNQYLYSIAFYSTETLSDDSFISGYTNTENGTYTGEIEIPTEAKSFVVCSEDYQGNYTNCTIYINVNSDTPTYIVTYDTNNHGEQPEAVSGVTSLPNPLPTLTASGYIFAGWYLDEALTQIATGGTSIYADTTLYAKWVAEETKTYTITFEENGGTAVQDLSGQTEIPTSLPTPIKSGYSFDGWYTDSTLTNLAMAGTELTSDITLYAKWSEELSEPSEPIEGVQNVVANFNGQLLEEYMLEGLKINKENVIGLDEGYTPQTNCNAGGGYPEKMAFIGDSLTYGSTVTGGTPSYYENYYNYPYFASAKLNVKEYVKIAIPGGTSTTVWNTNASDIQNITDSLAVIFLGTNSGLTNSIDTDCNGDDLTAYASTVIGNYGKIIKTLQDNGNKVVLCQCFYTTGDLTTTNDTIAALGERFGCDVVLISNDTRTELMLAKYHTAYNGYIDTIHFNNIGHLKFAEIVCEQITQFMFENPYKYEMYKSM